MGLFLHKRNSCGGTILAVRYYLKGRRFYQLVSEVIFLQLMEMRDLFCKLHASMQHANKWASTQRKNHSRPNSCLVESLGQSRFNHCCVYTANRCCDFAAMVNHLTAEVEVEHPHYAWYLLVKQSKLFVLLGSKEVSRLVIIAKKVLNKGVGT